MVTTTSITAVSVSTRRTQFRSSAAGNDPAHHLDLGRLDMAAGLGRFRRKPEDPAKTIQLSIIAAIMLNQQPGGACIRWCGGR